MAPEETSASQAASARKEKRAARRIAFRGFLQMTVQTAAALGIVVLGQAGLAADDRRYNALIAVAGKSHAVSAEGAG